MLGDVCGRLFVLDGVGGVLEDEIDVAGDSVC